MYEVETLSVDTEPFMVQPSMPAFFAALHVKYINKLMFSSCIFSIPKIPNNRQIRQRQGNKMDRAGTVTDIQAARTCLGLAMAKSHLIV